MCFCARTYAHSFSIGEKKCQIIFRTTKLRVLNTLNRRYYACAFSGPYPSKSRDVSNSRICAYLSYTVIHMLRNYIFFFSCILVHLVSFIFYFTRFFLYLLFLCTSNFLFYKALIIRSFSFLLVLISLFFINLQLFLFSFSCYVIFQCIFLLDILCIFLV